MTGHDALMPVSPEPLRLSLEPDSAARGQLTSATGPPGRHTQLELVLKVLKISILLTSSLAGLADLRPPCPHSSAVRIIRRLLSQQRRMVATEQQQHNNLMACSKLTAKKG